jgi:hypothetical protein
VHYYTGIRLALNSAPPFYFYLFLGSLCLDDSDHDDAEGYDALELHITGQREEEGGVEEEGEEEEELEFDDIFENADDESVESRRNQQLIDPQIIEDGDDGGDETELEGINHNRGRNKIKRSFDSDDDEEAGFYYNPNDETDIDPNILLQTASLEYAILQENSESSSSSSSTAPSSPLSPHAQYIKDCNLDTKPMRDLVFDEVEKFNEVYREYLEARQQPSQQTQQQHTALTASSQRRKRRRSLRAQYTQKQQDSLAELNHIFIENNFSKKGEDQVIKWVSNNIPPTILEMPKPTEKGRTLDEFQHPKLNRRFPITVCPGGCMAYLGKSKYLTHCTVCQLPKARKCTRASCSGQAAFTCDKPWHERKPFKELYYYSLILRIVTDIHLGKLPSLLCDVILENEEGKTLKSNYIHDIAASEVAKEAMKEMRAKAKRHKRQRFVN